MKNTNHKSVSEARVWVSLKSKTFQPELKLI